MTRTRPLLYIFLLFIGIFLFYQIGEKRVLSIYHSDETSASQINSATQVLQAKLAETTPLIALHKADVAYSKQLPTFLPTTLDVPTLITNVYALAQSSGVVITVTSENVSPQSIAPVSNGASNPLTAVAAGGIASATSSNSSSGVALSTVSVTVTVNGLFVNDLKFITDLSAFPSVVTVPGFTYSSDQSGVVPLALTLSFYESNGLVH